MKSILLSMLTLLSLYASNTITPQQKNTSVNLADKCIKEARYPMSANVKVCFDLIDYNEMLLKKLDKNENNAYILGLIEEDLINVGYGNAFFICVKNGPDINCLNNINEAVKKYGLKKGDITKMLLGEKIYKRGKLINK